MCSIPKGFRDRATIISCYRRHNGTSRCTQTSWNYRKFIVTLRPKAGIGKSEQTFIARQGLGEHIPVATNTQATIE
jgi:hypothetical protein